MTIGKVTRETRAECREAGRYRRIVVTIYPNGIIGFRAKGTRREYMMSAAWGYQHAVQSAAYAERPKRRRRRVNRGLLKS